MKERLQKIISGYGIASRRQAEKLLLEGRVTINGIAASVGDTADAEVDEIAVDGHILSSRPEHVYIMLNKPRGYVTTLHDERGRKNVTELVKDCGMRVYPVGRLDQYSEGLLILTNDGEFTNKLTHPKGKVEKKYHVWVNSYDKQQAAKLESSIEIDGRPSIPAKVRLISLKDKSAMLEFTLYEGRNRQIRRLCEYAGMQVSRLKRIQEGHLCLGDLQVGKWRMLSAQEVRLLQEE